MLEQIATIKLFALIGYAILFVVLVQSRVAFSLKLHFGLYLFGLGAWQLTSFAVTVTSDPSAALVWYNLQASAGSLQSVIFLPLTRAFLHRRGHHGIDAAAYAWGAVAIGTGVLQLAVHHVVSGGAGYFVPVFDGAIELVIAAAYLFWGWGVVLLVRGLIRERVRLQKNRIAYVLAGAVVVMIGGATNFTRLQAYPVDTICTLINALLVSYAVTRYRLVDTGTVLRRGLALVGMMAVGVCGYILLSLAAGLLVRAPAPEKVSLGGLAGFIILLSLTTLLGWKVIRPLLDRVSGGVRAATTGCWSSSPARRGRCWTWRG